jgi:hypothetical protein
MRRKGRWSMEKKEPKMKEKVVEITIEEAYKLLIAVLPSSIESAQERSDAFTLISIFDQMIVSTKQEFKISASLVSKLEKKGA